MIVQKNLWYSLNKYQDIQDENVPFEPHESIEVEDNNQDAPVAPSAPKKEERGILFYGNRSVGVTRTRQELLTKCDLYSYLRMKCGCVSNSEYALYLDNINTLYKETFGEDLIDDSDNLNCSCISCEYDKSFIIDSLNLEDAQLSFVKYFTKAFCVKCKKEVNISDMIAVGYKNKYYYNYYAPIKTGISKVEIFTPKSNYDFDNYNEIPYSISVERNGEVVNTDYVENVQSGVSFDFKIVAQFDGLPISQISFVEENFAGFINISITAAGGNSIVVYGKQTYDSASKKIEMPIRLDTSEFPSLKVNIYYNKLYIMEDGTPYSDCIKDTARLAGNVVVNTKYEIL